MRKTWSIVFRTAKPYKAGEEIAQMKAKLAAAEAVVELARKAIASRKDALQHARATQAECDLAKALGGR